MAYNIIYRLQFKNFEGNDVEINISDVDSGTGVSPTYIDLECVKAEIRSSNDDEDKFSPIRSKKFTCSFRSTSTYNVNTFLSASSVRFYTEVFINGTNIFYGYLVNEGAKEAFLPSGLFTVELTASDNLSVLKGEPLRKLDDTVPLANTHYLLIDLIVMCLYKTTLSLPIKAVISLREEHNTGVNDVCLKNIYSKGYTFESDVDEREDSYTVLSKILKGLGCFICQENGSWWILRVDEMRAAEYNIYTFSSTGTYLGIGTPTTYAKIIGKGETIKLINADAEVFPESGRKYVKSTFNLQYPLEIICNKDYTRGTVNGTITVPSGYVAYNPLECWVNGKNPHGSVINTAVDKVGYMRKKVTNGYEEERILVLPKLTSSGFVHYWMTETVSVNAKDKFRFSVDRRLDTDHTGSGWSNDSIFKIRLRGNDGSYWSMIGNASNGKIGSWKVGSGGFPTQSYDWVYQTSTEDETQWVSHSVEVDPCPVDGNVDIMLFQTNIYGLANDTHFANVEFDYIPLINGVYQIVKSQYHKISTSDQSKLNIEEEVFISDCILPNVKGSLFRDNSGTKVLVGNWYDYTLGTSGGLGLERFGYWHTNDLWNQYNRVTRRIQGNLLGMDTSTPTNIPGLLHQYFFEASTEHTDTKWYMLLSYSQDLRACTWDGTFSEVYDSAVGKDYTSTHEFKYSEK